MRLWLGFSESRLVKLLRKKLEAPKKPLCWCQPICCCLVLSLQPESLRVATHLVVDSPYKHAPSEGLDDDGGPADPLVGLVSPPHAVLLLEHHGRPGPPQMLGQPGEGESGGPD